MSCTLDKTKAGFN